MHAVAEQVRRQLHAIHEPGGTYQPIFRFRESRAVLPLGVTSPEDDTSPRVLGPDDFEDVDAFGHFELVDAASLWTFIVILFRWRASGGSIWARMFDVAEYVPAVSAFGAEVDETLTQEVVTKVLTALEDELQGDWRAAVLARGAVQHISGIRFIGG